MRRNVRHHEALENKPIKQEVKQEVKKEKGKEAWDDDQEEMARESKERDRIARVALLLPPGIFYFFFIFFKNKI